MSINPSVRIRHGLLLDGLAASCHLDADPPGPGADPADDDGDGVPLAADQCPDGIGSGAKGYDGCSRADVALRAPTLIAGPVAQQFRRVFSEVEALASASASASARLRRACSATFRRENKGG
jgi:hypothetical protein